MVLSKHDRARAQGQKMAEAMASGLNLATLPAGSAQLQKLREKGLKSFLQSGVPTPSEEAWKYTNLAPLAKQNFENVGAPCATGDLAGLLRKGSYAGRIVTVNGHVSAELSDLSTLPEGVSLEPTANVLKTAPKWAENYFKADMKARENALTALNTALMADGFALRVAAGVKVQKPIDVLHVTSGKEQAHIRCLFDVADGAEVTITETFSQHDSSWCNSVTEGKFGKGAKVRLYRRQDVASEAFLTTDSNFTLTEKTTLEALTLNSGGLRLVNTANIALNGEKAHVTYDGGCLTRNGRHGDSRVLVSHNAPNATADVTHRHVVGSDGHSIFQGKFYVAEGADGTDAKMMSQNLLLSDTGKIDSKPELEIYADDVKCAHGATCGNLNETALFYLQSRGIPALSAQAMLIEGFLEDLLSHVHDTHTHVAMSRQIHSWMQTMKMTKSAES